MTMGSLTAEEREIRQRKLVKGLMGGKTAGEAAVEAGYAKATALKSVGRELKRPSVQLLMSRALVDAGIDDRALADAAAEGIEAMRTVFFQHEGKVTDSREIKDWGARTTFFRHVVQILGGFAPQKHEVEVTTYEGRLRQMMEEDGVIEEEFDDD